MFQAALAKQLCDLEVFVMTGLRFGTDDLASNTEDSPCCRFPPPDVMEGEQDEGPKVMERRSSTKSFATNIEFDTYLKAPTFREPSLEASANTSSAAGKSPTCTSMANTLSNTDGSWRGTQRGGTYRRQHLMQRVVSEFDSCQTVGGQIRKGFSRRLKSMFGDKDCFLYAMETMFSMFIVLNCITIGISSDRDPQWRGWLAIEGAFSFVFSGEMCWKIYLHRQAYWRGKDRWWNLFEATLVVVGIVDLSFAVNRHVKNSSSSGSIGISFLRSLRLARITRLLRLCRMEIFTELMIMIRGALGGMRTLFWATLLICLPMYAASILFRETLGGSAGQARGAELFESVPLAFFTLFRCIVTQECTDIKGRPIFALVADAYGWGFSFMYGVLFLLMQFGLFNVIVAIFIENVLAGAKTNELIMRRNRLQNKDFFTEKMVELVSQIYLTTKEHDGEDVTLPPLRVLALEASHMEVSPEIFEEVCSIPHVQNIFRDLSMAEEDLVNLFELLDVDGNGYVDMAELFDGVAKLRGSPCRSDLVSLVFMMESLQEDVWEQHELNEDLARVLTQLVARLNGTAQPSSTEHLQAAAAAAAAAGMAEAWQPSMEFDGEESVNKRSEKRRDLVSSSRKALARHNSEPALAADLQPVDVLCSPGSAHIFSAA